MKNPAENPSGCREALGPAEVVVRLLVEATKVHGQAQGVSMAMKDGRGALVASL